jgi:hypothetical protein
LGELLAKGRVADTTARIPEELAVQCWSCLQAVYNSCEPRGAFGAPAMRLRVGHVVSLALDIAADVSVGKEMRRRAIQVTTPQQQGPPVH